MPEIAVLLQWREDEQRGALLVVRRVCGGKKLYKCRGRERGWGEEEGGDKRRNPDKHGLQHTKRAVKTL